MSTPDQHQSLEATSHYLVMQRLASNPAVQRFKEGLTAYECERFEQIAQDVGYALLHDGIRRLGGQLQLGIEEQAAVLGHETNLFLQGSAEYRSCLYED